MRGGRQLAASAALIAVVAAAAVNGASSGGRSALQNRPLAAGVAMSSTNWAGYAVASPDPATAMSFTSVTGTWKQAAAVCGGRDSDSASSFWVGLGGYNQGTQALEQIGTEADCNPSGPPSYYGWYELVPKPPISFALRIRPGDTVTSSVTYDGKRFTLTLRNRTRGTVAIQRAAFTAPDVTSAEWIVEAPSMCLGDACDVAPLANFGGVTMSKLATTANGHTGTLADPSWTATPIQLLPNDSQSFYGGPQEGVVSYNSTAGTCLPASLAGDGGSFRVAWASTAQPDC